MESRHLTRVALALKVAMTIDMFLIMDLFEFFEGERITM
jgi:hypothetical protein